MQFEYTLQSFSFKLLSSPVQTLDKLISILSLYYRQTKEKPLGAKQPNFTQKITLIRQPVPK